MAKDNPTYVKLNLSVPVLERLLGGDTDAEIEIRQGVIAEFAKRHLSNQLSRQFDLQWQTFIREEVGKALQEKIGQKMKPSIDNAFLGGISLKAEVRELLNKEMDRQLKNLIDEKLVEMRKFVEAQIERERAAAVRNVQQQIQAALAIEIRDKIRNGVQEHLDGVAQAFNNQLGGEPSVRQIRFEVK